jgi:thymidylate kinase
MAENTVIVEFVGLPACGKSTLCESIKKYEIANNKKVAVWNDLTMAFKHTSVLKMLDSISISQFYKYIKLFTSLTVKKERKYYMYWFALKISLLYRFAQKYLDVDLVLIDHGFFQQAVSMQCGDDVSLNKAFMKQFKKILNSETKIDYLIKCDLDYKIAMQRMIQRKRLGEGRLDAVSDEGILETMFLKEEKNFSCILECAKDVNSVKKFIIVDMSKEPSEIRDLVLDLL